MFGSNAFLNQRSLSPSAPATPNVSLDAAGLVAVADLTTIQERTVLTGNATLMDVFISCPGLHMQQKSTGLNAGEYPACGNMVSGYVFRVENPATVYYLQRVGKTGHLTTLNVSKIRSTISGLDGRRPWYSHMRSALFPHFDTSYPAGFVYLIAALWGIAVLILMGVMHDWWGFGVVIMLMVARLGNIIIIRRRAEPGWFGASEPGVDGDLLVLLSQDRWVRIQGEVDHLKAVTSGQWLRDPTMRELGHCFLHYDRLSRRSPLLLGGSVALLAIANSLTDKLLMHGYVIQRADGEPKKYRRRVELADELVKEMGRDDWAIRMGMIPHKADSDESVTPGPVVM